MFKKVKEDAKKKLSSKKYSGKKEQAQAGPSQAGPAHPDPAHSSPAHPGPAHPHASRPGSAHSGSSHKSNVSLTNEECLNFKADKPPYDPYKYCIENWPQRSDPGHNIPHRYIGPHDANADERILQDPLDWKDVRKMNEADRKRHIVARANFFTQSKPWALRIQSYTKLDKWIREAEKGDNGGFSLEKPLHPLTVNREQLAKDLPPSPGESALHRTSLNNRMNDYATFTKMTGTMQILKGDPMVVFGAWAMSLAKSEKSPIPGAPEFWDQETPIRMQVQNAAILATHKHLEVRYGKHIPLYLQDPNYVEADRKALYLLKHPRATIVNADHENDWQKAPWKYSFKNRVLEQEGQDVDIHWPGLGIKNYSAGILEVLENEYDRVIMEKETQQRFLGNPTLYLHKPADETTPGSSGYA